MAKKFSELRLGMTQGSRKQSEAKAGVMLAEMPLNGLRRARGLSQEILTDSHVSGQQDTVWPALPKGR